MIVGFSGGGDSCALLSSARRRGLSCVAVIIDHGLRDGAAHAAAWAAAFATNMGASVETVRLSGLRGGQAEARRARHLALIAAARRHGAAVIALGHTRDDQAETVLMRLARGSGLRGAAGMAGADWSPIWPDGHGLAIIRPLLGMDRMALRADLVAQGLDWLEDPANASPRYLRSAARLALRDAPDARRRLAAIAVRVRAVIDARDAALWAWVAGHVVQDGDRRLSAPWPVFADLPGADQAALLARLAASVSGAARLPQPSAVMAALGLLSQTPGLRTTLAGAWIDRRRGRLILQPEPPRRAAPAAASPPPPALRPQQRLRQLLNRPGAPSTGFQPALSPACDD